MAPGYAAICALALNFAVSTLLPPVLKPFSAGSDKTAESGCYYERAEYPERGLMAPIVKKL